MIYIHGALLSGMSLSTSQPTITPATSRVAVAATIVAIRPATKPIPGIAITERPASNTPLPTTPSKFVSHKAGREGVISPALSPLQYSGKILAEGKG